MKKILFIFAILAAFCTQSFALTRGLPVIDRTCKNCDRRYLDSINVFNRRPIRINQSGFRPQDYKYAYVADIPVGTKFSVIDANSGLEEFSGVTTMIKKTVKPGIWVRGAFNSLVNSYVFQYLYDSDSTSNTSETLTRAEFTPLSKQGEYFIVIGSDTSATFHIHPSIYNSVLEYALQFFGIQRCGDTKSHFHAPCHLKDGSMIHKDLTGGWHDCGDHFKVSETVGYATYVLSLVYLTYKDKAEDLYGNSYADTVFTDGIPDLLYEAKMGTDYILKLYNASKEDGLLEKGDMYHTVGMSDYDHDFWDLPERQDRQSQQKGGPDRLVLSGIGTNVAGIYAAALANVGHGFKVFDPDYSDSLLEAAKDIYAKIVKPTMLKDPSSFAEPCARKGKATTYRTSTPYTFDGKGYYSGVGLCEDDAAAAAVSLWYATADSMYKNDLFYNPKLTDSGRENGTAAYDLAFFGGGYLGTGPGFNNSWATDYQNLFSYVLFALQKLILTDNYDFYGLNVTERDMLSKRVMAAFRKQIETNSSGDSVAVTYPGSGGEPRESPTSLHVETPYNLVWDSFDWGVIRYNMGSAVAVFLLYELTKDERYLKVALDNMYYALGANPWDISFLMGAGDKNPQHPHNRSANPDGYNAGGMPYDYKCPIGALMGGRMPTRPLIEDWEKYTSTETCIDFSAQFLFPAQSLAETLPLDLEGPLFSNIAGTPITDTSAIISWDANEIALVTVFYSTTPNDPNPKSVQQSKGSKGGSVTLNGLTPGATYYFYLEGMDIKRNISKEDNHGQWYSFTMSLEPITISGVTICQVDNRSAKIYWWSSGRANGIVNYGTTTKAPTETQTAEGGAVLFHEALLTGLDANTTYYFTVSSGAATSNEYSFTTESYATYADLDIHIKPSSYQDDAACSKWEDCKEFFMIISNNDTIPFKDFEIRFYLNSSKLSPVVSNVKHCVGGSGQPDTGCDKDITFGEAKSDGAGAYYLPITVNGELAVSGSLSFQILFHTYYDPNGNTPATYKDLEGSWSLRPHMEETDPVQFKGIDLKNGPTFNRSESAYIEKTASGDTVLAYVKDPYVGVFYHGKHIYGYTPEDGENGGPQIRRNVALDFESPFTSPYFSIEKEDAATTYSAIARVTPSGLLDDVEKNGKSVNITPLTPGKTDAVSVHIDTVLAYGNNYMEWVAWHNHFANMNSENKYDCACAIVRSNVEIDTITIPPEQRYLEFNVDTVKAYSGRFVEVRVILKDSLKMQMYGENTTITLSSDANSILFYTSPEATLPTTTLDIVNGEAVFYIKSDVPVTSLIYGIGSTSKLYAYEAAKAVALIEEMPPWPIINVAKMIDQNCDNIPDAMYIELTNAYTETNSFNSIKVTYKNDTLTSTNVISLNGTELIVGLDIKDNINTNPSGSITLVNNVEGNIQESPDIYTDGMPPALLSISVLERLDTAKTDKVYLQFSEPISLPGLELPIRLFNGNTPINAPSVTDIRVYNDSLNVWEISVAFDAQGNSIVKEGMEGQLLETIGIADRSGNTLTPSCPQKKLPITLKIMPIPITYAYISDKDEDGRAEYVEVTFAQTIDQKHTPDKVSIIFGTAVPETLWTSNYTFSSDRLTAVLNLETPFALGNTSGNYTSIVNGTEMSGAGLVIQHLGTGAAYETNSSYADDKVGPIFVSASLNSTSDMEYVSITASEPLFTIDANQVLYLRERNDAAFHQQDLISFNMSLNNTSLNSFFKAEDEKNLMEGDRVRLAPLQRSAFADKAGNLPVTNNPWVTIGSDKKPKIKFKITMSNAVTKVDAKQPSTEIPGISNQDIRVYIVNPLTHRLDVIEKGTVVASIDTNVTKLSGAVWKFNMSVPRGTSPNEPPAWSSMNVKYEMPIYTNLGGYVNRVSGNYDVSSAYLSNNNEVTIFVEWANLNGGVHSKEGRNVGTGAYVYKAEIKCKFSPNPNMDEETQKRFSSKNTYEKTQTFGIKHIK